MTTLKRHRSSEGSDVGNHPPLSDPMTRVSRSVGADVAKLYACRLELSKRLATVDHTRLFQVERHRLTLVDYICTVTEEFRLKKSTAHVAVSYVDRILAIARIHPNEMILLSIVCILLAAKFEEPCGTIPTIGCLLDALKPSRTAQNETTNAATAEITTADVNDMEMVVFSGLDYRLFAITSVHFLELYSTLGLFFDWHRGDRLSGQEADFLCSEKTSIKDVNRYTEFFADLALQHVVFQSIQSVTMANVVLTCARRAVGVVPVWSSHIENVTGFRFDGNIAEIHNRLWSVYESGYRMHQVDAHENASVNLCSAGPLDSPLGHADLHLGSNSNKSFTQ